MTIFVEHVDILSHNDINPNHEKIIPKTLSLNLTLLPGARVQESVQVMLPFYFKDDIYLINGL